MILAPDLVFLLSQGRSAVDPADRRVIDKLSLTRQPRVKRGFVVAVICADDAPQISGKRARTADGRVDGRAAGERAQGQKGRDKCGRRFAPSVLPLSLFTLCILSPYAEGQLSLAVYRCCSWRYRHLRRLRRYSEYSVWTSTSIKYENTSEDIRTPRSALCEATQLRFTQSARPSQCPLRSGPLY